MKIKMTYKVTIEKELEIEYPDEMVNLDKSGDQAMLVGVGIVQAFVEGDNELPDNITVDELNSTVKLLDFT